MHAHEFIHTPAQMLALSTFWWDEKKPRSTSDCRYPARINNYCLYRMMALSSSALTLGVAPDQKRPVSDSYGRRCGKLLSVKSFLNEKSELIGRISRNAGKLAYARTCVYRQVYRHCTDNCCKGSIKGMDVCVDMCVNMCMEMCMDVRICTLTCVWACMQSSVRAGWCKKRA